MTRTEAYAEYVCGYVEVVERRVAEEREEGGVLVDELTGAFFPAFPALGVFSGRTERLKGQP